MCCKLRHRRRMDRTPHRHRASDHAGKTIASASQFVSILTCSVVRCRGNSEVAGFRYLIKECT